MAQSSPTPIWDNLMGELTGYYNWSAYRGFPFSHNWLLQCGHDDFNCPETSPCGQLPLPEGRDG